MKREIIYSFCLLIILGFIWGTGYSIARFAVTHNVSPLGYSFWQSLGPAVILSLMLCYPQKSRHKGQTTFNLKSSLVFYFLCGLTGIAIPNSIMYFSAAHLPASILAMVVNIVPIIAYPLALSFKQESFNWMRLTGICFALLGLMLIILPKSSLPSQHMVPWVMLSLLTPVSFAICSVYIAGSKVPHSSLGIAARMLVSSSFLLLPLVLVTHNFYMFHFPLTPADWVILLEIILSSIGYGLYIQLLKVAGPVYYSLVDTIVVLTGIFWGVILFHEYLNQWTGLAVLAILMGLLLVTQQQRKQFQQKLTYLDATSTH